MPPGAPVVPQPPRARSSREHREEPFHMDISPSSQFGIRGTTRITSARIKSLTDVARLGKVAELLRACGVSVRGKGSRYGRDPSIADDIAATGIGCSRTPAMRRVPCWSATSALSRHSERTIPWLSMNLAQSSTSFGEMAPGLLKSSAAAGRSLLYRALVHDLWSTWRARDLALGVPGRLPEN